MHSKNFYFNMGVTSFVVMLLFIVVFYIGIMVNHWLTFDVGLFGAIIGCIATVYNVIQHEKATMIEEQIRQAMMLEMWEEEHRQKTKKKSD